MKKQSDLNSAQQEFFTQHLPSLLLGGAAAGGVTGGLMGLKDLLAANLKEPPEPPEPTFIDIPYKLHNGAPKKPRRLINTVKQSSIIPEDSYLWGSSATTPSHIPMAWPLGVGGIGLSAFLAHKGMRGMANKMVADKEEDEVDQAKEDYEKSLLEQFKPLASHKVKTVKISSELTPEITKSILEKTAAAGTKEAQIAEKLDQLSEKTALFDDAINSFKDYAGFPLGAYLATAGGLAGLGHIGAYKYLQSSDPQAAMKRKTEELIQARQSRRPSDIYARLTPVDDQGHRVEEDEEEQHHGPEHEASPKIASDLQDRAVKFVNKLLGY